MSDSIEEISHLNISHQPLLAFPHFQKSAIVASDISRF
jgi:hypothetical protein